MPESKAEPRAQRAARASWASKTSRRRSARTSPRACCSGCSSSAAILHQPELLILDEPFSGLDPVSVRLLKGVIAHERRRGTTILFSTHVMAQAEELCDRVVMIHKGRKVLDEPMSSLRRRYDPTRVLFEPLDRGRQPGCAARRARRGVDAAARWGGRTAPGAGHRPRCRHSRGGGARGAGAHRDRAHHGSKMCSSASCAARHGRRIRSRTAPAPAGPDRREGMTCSTASDWWRRANS